MKKISQGRLIFPQLQTSSPDKHSEKPEKKPPMNLPTKTNLNNVLHRIEIRQAQVQRQLDAALQAARISPAVFALLPAQTKRFNQQQVAKAQAAAQQAISQGGISWEELTRPSLSDLSSAKVVRLLVA